MLYYLFDWLDSSFDFPGAGVFQYISFRAAAAVITSLLITIVFGKKLINFLRRKQVGETVRDLGLEGQKAKEGTPTIGGLIFIIPTVITMILLYLRGSLEFSHNLIILTENSTDRFRNFDSAITYQLLEINCNIYNANCL